MLKTFLDAKPLYYDEIDYTRMPRVYEKIKSKLKLPKIIHLIGTNGKGTTGRFLATALYNLGYNTGHYTSPHIIDFNERIWLNGADVSLKQLEQAHIKLLDILDKSDASTLSYFEYTTLLAMVEYQECEYLVLEAGLGGEHDATAVFEKVLTLVTPIDLDHEAFLGSTLEEIARTKLNAIQNNAILAAQEHLDVYKIAKELEAQKNVKIYKKEMFLSQKDLEKIQAISKNLSLVSYLEDNLSLAISALNFLNIKYEIDSFHNARLFGRLTQLDENILLDVGHNTLAAQKIAESLAGEQYVLVYNSYKDKNYAQILKLLKPIILEVDIIKVNESRIEKKEILEKTLDDLEIIYKDYQGIKKDTKYLVFGSFSVIESFLKGYSG